jgi:hypothetical protein
MTVYGLYGTAGGDATGTGDHIGVYGTSSDASAGVNYGVYGTAANGTENWGLYTPDNARFGDATADRHRFFGWFQSGSSSDDHRILPNAGAFGYVGDATYYWNAMYADTYYGKTTTIQAFDIYPDLDLLDAMEIIPYTDDKTGETRLIFDPDTIPDVIKGDPEVHGEGAENFVDMVRALGFTFGSFRQLRMENREREMDLLTEIDLRTPDSSTGTQEMQGNLQIVLDKDGDETARFSLFRDGEGGLQEEVLRADEEGNLYTRGTIYPASLDLAEFHPVSEPVEEGDVLVVDRARPRVFEKCSSDKDKAVVGIVSGRPGIALGKSIERVAALDREVGRQIDIARETGDTRTEARLWNGLEERFSEVYAPVALSGTVLCKAETGNGSIEIGDLLVSSSIHGHAMRDDNPAPGTVIGKALEPLDSGTGMIKVLVMLR